LLKTNGYDSIELSIAPEIHHYGLPTFVPWIENLIGNVEGALNNLIDKRGIGKAVIDDAINELKDLQKNQNASAYFYWNRARAIRPKS